ncbi:hypothetical protein ACC691_37475, partial [Rhizobium johnstonii]|uniref:hypothetical protein n=1 Tax=Rhizobium johnstonii TaxID=3019933 RepID=UPI003F9CD1EF
MDSFVGGAGGGGADQLALRVVTVGSHPSAAAVTVISPAPVGRTMATARPPNVVCWVAAIPSRRSHSAPP